MTIDLALKTVIEYLDEIMEQVPSREVADACNYLQTLRDSL